MNRSLLSGLLVALVVLPALALAHPPAVDPHNSCVERRGEPVPPGNTTTLFDTLSYLAPLGTSLSCTPSEVAEWGSDARRCAPPPYVGAIVPPSSGGAFCGPVVPSSLFGGTATCTWFPVSTMMDGVHLIIGFDTQTGVPPAFNGLVNLVTDGERPVYGPFPPGAWRVPNPHALPARVIAYPTNTDGTGAITPGDVHQITCVTP